MFTLMVFNELRNFPNFIIRTTIPSLLENLFKVIIIIFFLITSLIVVYNKVRAWILEKLSTFNKFKSTCVMWVFSCPVTVSYTHLDVYKRQVDRLDRISLWDVL